MPIKRRFIYEAVIALYRQGLGPKAIVLQSGVPETTVRRWIGLCDPEQRAANLRQAAAQRKLKDQETRAVVALRRKDIRPSQIAIQLNMTVGRVNRLLADFRARYPEGATWSSLGDAQRERMWYCREARMSMGQIAKTSGLAKSTVHHHCKALELHGPIARRDAGGKSAGIRTARGAPPSTQDRQAGRTRSEHLTDPRGRTYRTAHQAHLPATGRSPGHPPDDRLP